MSIRASRFLIGSFALVFAAATTAAPAKPAPDTDPSSPGLVVRGDQVSTAGLVSSVAKAFAATGDGHLVIQPFSTVEAIDQTLAGSVDMAASARPAYPARAQESALTFTPIVWDALVLITNEANPVSNVTLKQLHNIYYGKITNWSAVGGLDQKIDLDGVAVPLDGVQFSYRRLMFGNGNNPVAVPRLFINIDSLQQEVALDPKALALSTLAHATGKKGIKIIPVEGVVPSLATLENGTYPLPLQIYLAWQPGNPKAATIQKFLDFLAGDQAAGILRQHGLLPYHQAIVLNSISEKDRINALGARMVAEGLPPEYAPGYEFERLTSRYADLAYKVHLQQAAANEVASNNAQRIALAKAAGVDPSPQAVSKPAPATYTVVKGDTLSKIAQAHSVSVADLRNWNDLHGDTLSIGQELKLAPTP